MQSVTEQTSKQSQSADIAKAKAARTKLKGWHRAFLKAYANSANMRVACDAVGIAYTTAWRAAQSNPAFAAALADARQQALDYAEAVLLKRGTVGEPEPIWMQSRKAGQPVKVDTIYRKDTRALIAWLQANHREKYGQYVVNEHTGPQGTPLPAPVLAPATQVIVNIPSNGRGDSQAELEQGLMEKRALAEASDAQADKPGQ